MTAINHKPCFPLYLTKYCFIKGIRALLLASHFINLVWACTISQIISLLDKSCPYFFLLKKGTNFNLNHHKDEIHILTLISIKMKSILCQGKKRRGFWHVNSVLFSPTFTLCQSIHILAVITKTIQESMHLFNLPKGVYIQR